MNRLFVPSLLIVVLAGSILSFGAAYTMQDEVAPEVTTVVDKETGYETTEGRISRLSARHDGVRFDVGDKRFTTYQSPALENAAIAAFADNITVSVLARPSKPDEKRYGDWRDSTLTSIRLIR